MEIEFSEQGDRVHHRCLGQITPLLANIMLNSRTLVFVGAHSLFLLACFLANPAAADEVIIRHEGQELQLFGRVLITAQDNGILFQDLTGKLWLVEPEAIVSRNDSETPPVALKKDEISQRVLQQLPNGFRIETTNHYVIAYNTERAYAKYISGLYERLLKGFTGHWKSKRSWKLDEPEEPLVAIIFRSHAEYAEFVKKDIGIEPPQTMVAYYNLMTNQVVMYDLTSEFGAAGQKIQNDRQIMDILANPNALVMITTIIHEGSHQLMYNTGMQQRLAAVPLWVSEGLAMYFEPPDVSSNSGWRAIGQVNQLRLATFRQSLVNKPRSPDYFQEMLTSDEVLQDGQQLLDRYAEAWALNYFLLNKHSSKYVDYLKFLSQKEPLIEDSADTRLEEFQRFFPMGIDKLEKEFLNYMRTVN